MNRVVAGEAEAQHRSVVSAGDRRPVEEVGGESMVVRVEGATSDGCIEMRVVLDPHGVGPHRTR